VSFSVSLFTKVALEDMLKLLTQHFDGKTISFIRQVLTTTYFLYNGYFCDQRDGSAPRHRNSQRLHKFFEQQAISLTAKKPVHWYKYVDNTFVVWKHGKEELKGFIQHLNSIHPNIKFAMKVENNNALSLPDVLVRRRLGS